MLTIQSSFLGVDFSTLQKWIEQLAQAFIKDLLSGSLHILAITVRVSEVTTATRQ